MSKKILLSILFLFNTFLWGESIEFNEICYKLNKDTLEYEEVLNVTETIDNSALSLTNRMLTWLKGDYSNRPCDKIVMVNTTTFKNNDNRQVTIQSMTKEVSSTGDVDFISIEDIEDNYLIGFTSKNFGIGTGYILNKSLKYNKKGNQNILYSLEQINFKKFLTDKIEQYCKIYNTSPNLIVNNFSFTNFANIYLQGLSIADTEANAAQLKDTGILLFDEDICTSRSKIISYLDNIETHDSGGDKGWTFNFGDKMFREGGFIINYPYVSSDKIDQIIGSYFANIMYENNIQRGVMFSDKPIDIQTKHWTSGKAWNKKDHVRKTLNIETESYDITYTSIPLPFEEISVSSNWPNSELTYVNVINPLPSFNNSYFSFTSDNHIASHSFRKGGEIDNLGSYSNVKEISKKRDFNWALFIAIIVLVVVASVFTLGTGTFAVASEFTMYTVSHLGTNYLALGILGTGSMLSFSGTVAAATVGTLISIPSATGSGITVTAPNVENIVKHALYDVTKSGSVKITSLTFIPSIIEKIEPVQFVNGSAYKSIISHSENSIDSSQWNSDWGTTANYIIYQNREIQIGTFYNQTFVEDLYNLYIKNLFINEDSGGILNCKDALEPIMVKEWKNSVTKSIRNPQPSLPISPGSDDTPLNP